MLEMTESDKPFEPRRHRIQGRLNVSPNPKNGIRRSVTVAVVTRACCVVDCESAKALFATYLDPVLRNAAPGVRRGQNESFHWTCLDSCVLNPRGHANRVGSTCATSPAGRGRRPWKNARSRSPASRAAEIGFGPGLRRWRCQVRFTSQLIGTLQASWV